MMKNSLLIVLVSTFLFGQDGCSIFKNMGSSSIERKTTIEKEEVEIVKKLKITSSLTSIESMHDGQIVIIEREGKHLKECPPFCIQPMNIKEVLTVGELETLDFIEKRQKKKLGLLLDVRENSLYQKATIPSAINLPLSMLDPNGNYYEKVLKLLGAKKRNEKWYFKSVQTLLIFGESSMSNEASEMINRLLDLNYPENKLLYYRGGFQSWSASGLSTY